MAPASSGRQARMQHCMVTAVLHNCRVSLMVCVTSAMTSAIAARPMTRPMTRPTPALPDDQMFCPVHRALYHVRDAIFGVMAPASPPAGPLMRDTAPRPCDERDVVRLGGVLTALQMAGYTAFPRPVILRYIAPSGQLRCISDGGALAVVHQRWSGRYSSRGGASIHSRIGWWFG